MRRKQIPNDVKMSAIIICIYVLYSMYVRIYYLVLVGNAQTSSQKAVSPEFED